MSLLLDPAGLTLVLGCLALGLGLAAAGPPWLTGGERVVIGIVMAVVSLTLLGYGLALAIGLTTVLVLLLAGIGLIAGGALLWRHARGLRWEMAGRPWGLAVAIAVVALSMGFLFARAVEVTPSGWLAHYLNTWSDWSSHASYATAFAYGQNLPPQNPIYAGTPFRYPFGCDFASALLLAGGWSIPAALTWPSWAMTLLTLSGLILWARRLTGGIGAGLVAVSLTLLGGGLGFWFFFGDAARLGLLNALAEIPRSYDRFDPPVNIQWYNPILSWYLPQRSFVFGAAIVIALLLLLTPLLQATPLWQWRTTVLQIAGARRRWSITSEGSAFMVAGALAGTLPLFHVHSLAALGLVTLILAALFPRPAWIGFFAVLLLLAVPRLLMAVPGDPGVPVEHEYPTLLIGWLSGSDFPAWFWIKNTGLFTPLLLLALLSPLALSGRSRLLIAPFIAVFLAANIVKFQPWDWDNTKLLVFWYLGSAVAVGAMLVRLFRSHLAGALAAAAIWLSLVGSGILSLLAFLPPQGPSYTWFTNEQLQLAAEVRRLTPAKAVFVTGEEPNNPVADVAGRSVLMSYPGWLWSYGINYTQREADLGRIFQGGVGALVLLHRYGADYVVIGPDELNTWHANLDYFDSRFRAVIRTEHYQVYAVPPA